MKALLKSLTLCALIGFTACDSATIVSNSEQPAQQLDRPVVSVKPIGSSAQSLGGVPAGLTANSERLNSARKMLATVTQGGVTLSAQALFDQDGNTTLDVTTGTLYGDDATGTITKLQVKAADPEKPKGTLWTKNFNNLKEGGAVIRTFEGLQPGQPLSFHANVKGFGKGTEVVKFSDTVKLRPDLEAHDLTLPAQAKVNEMVHIDALVTEINGDVGAQADCILRADGVEMDRASGMWIDAGQGVQCAFMVPFATTGVKDITVSAEGVVPGDWDTANNLVQGTIEIVEPTVELPEWHAYAHIDTDTYVYDYSERYYWSWYSYERHERTKTQDAYFNGYAYANQGLDKAQVTFPLDIDVRMTSGGNEWHSATLQGVQPTYSYSYDYGNGQVDEYACYYMPNSWGDEWVHLEICSAENPWSGEYSRVNYRRYSRSGVYYGRHYYGGNFHHTFTGEQLPYGNDVTFDVTFGNDDLTFTAEAVVPLQERSHSYSYSYYYYSYSYMRQYMYGSTSHYDYSGN